VCVAIIEGRSCNKPFVAISHGLNVEEKVLGEFELETGVFCSVISECSRHSTSFGGIYFLHFLGMKQ